jgi:DNA-binding SARP family transcriptional activator/tetratricopeptide (TPR) repeat protein
MQRLQVLLLGPPEIRWDNQLLSIQRRYPRSLLLYLAACGTMVSRQDLITLFWEEEPDTTARLRLRETLGKLKAALPIPSVLITEHDLVGLDFNSAYVDFLEFQELTQETRSGTLVSRSELRDSSDPLFQEVYQKLNRAVCLWRGKRFLSGADLPSTSILDEWLMSTSQQAEHHRSWAYERLSEMANFAGDQEQALRFAHAALETDELNEETHEKVLRLLIQMRHFHEAREYFNRYKDLIRRELQASPSPRMLALEQTIHLEGRHVHTLNPQTKKSWRVRSSLESPLVGRQAQLAQLNHAYQKGGAVFIFGESGLGKTRLVKEFVEHLEPQPRILLSRCLPNENSLPFQPIIDLSRDMITLEEWLQYPEEWVSHILPVMPDLKAVFPNVKPSLPVVPEQARGLLLEAVRQMGMILAREHRLVSFLDDAQWADEATLATLSYLLERTPFNRDALLIVAVRDDQPSPDIDSLLHHLEAVPNVSKIHLTRLDAEDISDITRNVLGKRPTSQVAHLLTRATGGNPLFLLESLRALRDNLPGQELSEKESLPLAENLVDLIHSRLHMLSAQLREMLEVAAVAGAEFSPSILEHVAHASPEVVIKAVEELANRQLIELVSQNGNEICCRFIHDKFREVLLLEINPLRAIRLHGEMARAIEALPGSKSLDQAAILAHHYEMAGELVAAYHYWLKAAIYSRHLFAYTDATRAFSRAQAVSENPGAHIDARDIAHLYVEWCEMADEIDDVGVIKQIGEKLLMVARQRQDNGLTGLSYTILCDALMDENRFEEGLTYVDRAIPILEKTDILSRLAHAYVQRGVCLYMLNRLGASEKTFLRVLKLDSESQDTSILRSRANSQFHLANIYNLAAWPVKSRRHALDALASFNETNHFFGQASVYSALLLSYHLTGEYSTAVLSGQRGLELAQMIKADRIKAVLHALLAMTEMSRGEIGPALEHANHTIEIGEQVRHPEITAIGYRMLGDLYGILGSHESAMTYYERGLAETAQSFWGADILMRLGYTCCHLGQFDRGLEYMQISEKICSESGQMMTVVIGKIGLATVSILLEDWEKAVDLARQVGKIAEARRMRVWSQAALSILGAAEFQKGNCAEAEAIFKRVIAQTPKAPNPWTEIRAQAYLEKIYRQEGIPSEQPRQRIQKLFSQIESSIDSSLDPSIWKNFQTYQNSDLCIF